jgi:putative transposase
MVSACARRQQVGYAHARGISIRRACSLLSVARSARNYVSRLQVKDAPALDCMRELSGRYPRFGYRRIQIFLAREGHPMSCDRTYRLWKLAGLQVPRKRPRRRVAGSRPRPLAPGAAGEMWAYDFVLMRVQTGSS